MPPKILSTFQAVVCRIDDAIAWVELIDEQGRCLVGQTPADELAQHGIGQGDHFRFIVKEDDNGEVFSVYEKIPERVLTKSEFEKIRKEVEKFLADYDLSDDY